MKKNDKKIFAACFYFISHCLIVIFAEVTNTSNAALQWKEEADKLMKQFDLWIAEEDVK